MQRPPLRSTKPSGESKSSLLAKAYQDDDAAYTMVKPRKNVKAKRVVDLVEVDDNSYVRYKGITVTKSGIIAARHRRKLTQLGLQHHVLGRTFP